ncbi:MAG: ABC transporter permease [Spirochaetales bacterium]|nr:ABC transporter permease [Spirochaetales bacterium]
MKPLKRYVVLFSQDALLAYRNGHVLVVAAIAVIMVLLVLFLPAEIKSGPGEYFLDETPGKPLAEALLRKGGNPDALCADRTELQKKLTDDKNALGVVISGSLENPVVTISKPKSVAEKSMNLLMATIDQIILAVGNPGAGEDLTTEYLRPRSESPALNLSGIPVFLAFEVGILGFLLVAVFIFQEKQEKTLRAYRVSPGGLAAYLMSKTLVFVALSVIYAAVVVVAGFGFSAPWGSVMLLVIYASTFMTLFGAGFAAWFHNLSHWFFPGLAILVLNMIPFGSYIFPSFNPAWVTVLPSYGLIFSLREALFPTGNADLIRTTLLTGLLWLAASTVFAAFSVRRKLMKGE